MMLRLPRGSVQLLREKLAICVNALQEYGSALLPNPKSEYYNQNDTWVFLVGCMGTFPSASAFSQLDLLCSWIWSHWQKPCWEIVTSLWTEAHRDHGACVCACVCMHVQISLSCVHYLINERNYYKPWRASLAQGPFGDSVLPWLRTVCQVSQGSRDVICSLGKLFLNV